MEVFLFGINHPGKAAHPNARPHWRAKAKAVSDTREECALAVMKILGPGKVRNWKCAWLRYYFGFPRKSRRDKDNLSAWAKGVQDGMVDAGLLADDNEVDPSPVQILVPAPKALLIEVSDCPLEDPLAEFMILRLMAAVVQRPEPARRKRSVPA